jgi:hypothetical protein
MKKCYCRVIRSSGSFAHTVPMQKHFWAILVLVVACGLGGATQAEAASGYGSDWYDYYGYPYYDDYLYRPIDCRRGYTEQYDAAGRVVGCAPIVSRASRVPPIRYNSSQYYWQCGSGYEIMYDDLYNKIGCRPSIVVRQPPRTYSNTSYCPSGYYIAYDDLYNRIGCER